MNFKKIFTLNNKTDDESENIIITDQAEDSQNQQSAGQDGQDLQPASLDDQPAGENQESSGEDRQDPGSADSEQQDPQEHPSIAEDQAAGQGKDLSEDPDLKRIRDKTFNKELGDLVSKIRKHEDKSLESEDGEVLSHFMVDKDSESALLQSFHELFYKAINVADLGLVNSAFNQFEIDVKLVFENLEHEIFKVMSDMKMDEFAVLNYNIEQRCYISHMSSIEGLDINNIIIDPDEALYTRIIKEKEGLVIDYNTIEYNKYYKKRFQLEDPDRSKFKYYFVSVKNIIDDYYMEWGEDQENGLPDKSLFPIIVILFKEKYIINPEFIFNKFRYKLPIYLILLSKKLLRKTKSLRTTDFNKLYYLNRYNFQQFFTGKNEMCYIIKCHGYLSKELLLTLRYLPSKIKDNLSGKSVVSRVQKDKFVVLIEGLNEKTLKTIVYELNKSFGNIFELIKYEGDLKNLTSIFTC